MRADILAKIKQHHYELGLHLHDDFLDKFNFKSYFVIDDVKNNAKTATLEKWDEWIKEGINNKDIQEYIAINPNTPEPILHKLLTTGRTYQDTIIDLAKRDDLTVALIKKMMAKANDKTIATLFTKLPYPSENINPKLADVIVPVIVEHIVDTKTTIPHTVYFDASEFTKDEKSILYLLDSDAILTENVLDKIASNKNLSDETRNRVFDMGCNYETLNSYTPYIAKKIYESAIESAIDNGEISWKINNIRNQAFEVLMNLANNKAIDDSMMIDMLNRIYHPNLLPFTSNGRLITETIDKVASPYIIDYIKEKRRKE